MRKTCLVEQNSRTARLLEECTERLLSRRIERSGMGTPQIMTMGRCSRCYSLCVTIQELSSMGGNSEEGAPQLWWRLGVSLEISCSAQPFSGSRPPLLQPSPLIILHIIFILLSLRRSKSPLFSSVSPLLPPSRDQSSRRIFTQRLTQ